MLSSVSHGSMNHCDEAISSVYTRKFHIEQYLNKTKTKCWPDHKNCQKLSSKLKTVKAKEPYMTFLMYLVNAKAPRRVHRTRVWGKCQQNHTWHFSCTLLMQRHQEGSTGSEFEANANKTMPHTLTMGRTITLSRLRKKTPNQNYTLTMGRTLGSS